MDEVDAWWLGQDSTREPRFDRVSFPCGLQADILSLRLPDTAATLGSSAVRGDRIVASVGVQTGRSPHEKELVYYDGPVDDPDLCGEGTGAPDGDGVAIVYLGACTDVPSAAVAAVGRDDYYGHSGTWTDVQDSLWLRLVSQQVRLSLAISGRGSVESDVPGLDCAGRCETDWDAGSVVALEPLPGEGQRFVRWTGACTGTAGCSVTLDAPRAVGALLAPERLGLVVSVAGGGKVTGAGAPCASSRCVRSLRSYTPVRLRATPVKGWRPVGWSGACAGRAATCTVPMAKATAVRARFVRI